MIVTRRTALKTSVGAGVALLLDNFRMFPESQAILTKRIPVSGELLPVVGLGSSQTFNVTPASPGYQAAREVIRLFREIGGKVIDTAPSYQRSEAFIGETVRSYSIQNDLFLATKVNVSGRGKAAAREMMENSSRVFGKQRIDLMQVWNLGDSIRSLTDSYLDQHFEAVTEFKAAGRAKYIGITTSRDAQYADFEAAMNKYKIDFVQLDYSIGQAERVTEQRLLPLAREKGIAVIVNRPFTTGQQVGSLFSRVSGRTLPPWAAEFDCKSWAQFFLKYVVSHPAVTCAIPGTGDPEHLRDNMGAAMGRLPDDAMRKRMTSYFDSM